MQEDTNLGRRIFHLVLGLAIVFLAWIGLLNGVIVALPEAVVKVRPDRNPEKSPRRPV